MTTQPRTPAGSPDGGQFAATTGAESSAVLDESAAVEIGKPPKFGWRMMTPQQARDAYATLARLVDQANKREDWPIAALYAGVAHDVASTYFPDGTPRGVADRCRDAGLDCMVPVFEILEARGIDPNLFDTFTADDIAILYEEHIGPTVDEVTATVHTVAHDATAHPDTTLPIPPRPCGPTADEMHAHAMAVSSEWGYPVVGHLIGVGIDRGDVTHNELQWLQPSTAAQMYNMTVGPAIDRLEYRHFHVPDGLSAR